MRDDAVVLPDGRDIASSDDQILDWMLRLPISPAARRSLVLQEVDRGRERQRQASSSAPLLAA